jgi:basic membrane protein A
MYALRKKAHCAIRLSFFLRKLFLLILFLKKEEKKKMKKLVGVLGLTALSCAAALSLASCGSSGDKFGFIFLHDENSTYDKNFIDAAKDVCKELKVKAVLKVGVDESEACYTAAKDLVNSGCKGVFADSFGHEAHMIRAAKEFKDVQFAHATGTNAHTEKLDNFHNAFASIYEGRYIAGVAAGMKLNEMLEAKTITEAKVGYVGAFNYAEVISGYTSFFLGVRSVCPSATMVVRYTDSWYDENAEAQTATTLIDDDKCVLISQHADSQGCPRVCNAKKVPNVFYNGANTALEDSYLTSSRINWRPFFKYFIESTLNGTKMDYDWTGTLANGAVEVYAANEKIAAKGTQTKMDEVKAALIAGTVNVFDTTTFTVSKFGDGKETFFNLNAKVDEDGKVTSYKADVNSDPKYEGDTEVVKGNLFQESLYRSAPYFDLRIDGITEK